MKFYYDYWTGTPIGGWTALEVSTYDPDKYDLVPKQGWIDEQIKLKEAEQKKLIDPILLRQITTRRADNRDGGKWRLEKKVDHKVRTKESPDHADAYVLCYYSYPIIIEPASINQPEPPKESIEEFANRLAFGDLHENIRKFYASTNVTTGRRKSFVVPV